MLKTVTVMITMMSRMREMATRIVTRRKMAESTQIVFQTNKTFKPMMREVLWFKWQLVVLTLKVHMKWSQQVKMNECVYELVYMT